MPTDGSPRSRSGIRGGPAGSAGRVRHDPGIFRGLAGPPDIERGSGLQTHDHRLFRCVLTSFQVAFEDAGLRFDEHVLIAERQHRRDQLPSLLALATSPAVHEQFLAERGRRVPAPIVRTRLDPAAIY
jgi:hypothetical protein